MVKTFHFPCSNIHSVPLCIGDMGKHVCLHHSIFFNTVGMVKISCEVQHILIDYRDEDIKLFHVWSPILTCTTIVR